MRRSMSTMSGRSERALDRPDPVSGGSDDVDVVEQTEQHGQSVADDWLVVGD